MCCRRSSRRRFTVLASSSLDDQAEKQAAIQKKKVAYDKDLADLAKHMVDPNEDPLFGRLIFETRRRKKVFFEHQSLVRSSGLHIPCCQDRYDSGRASVGLRRQLSCRFDRNMTGLDSALGAVAAPSFVYTPKSFLFILLHSFF